MHLVEIPGQQRETEAILRLLDTDPLTQPLFNALGLAWPFCWCLVQMNQKQLVSTRRGDVDILAGNFRWHDPEQFSSYVNAEAVARPNWNPSLHFDFAARRLAAEGGISWPPSTEYLVAIEVKCAYYTDRIHAAKSDKGAYIRRQVSGLQAMGFDHVALLDMIANKPAAGSEMNAWLEAAWQAHDGFQDMLGILRDRLCAGTAIHHFALSIGAVIGRDENLSGTGKPVSVHRGTVSFDSSDATMASNRREMNRKIRQLLIRQRSPHYYPHVLVDCDLCKTIHGIGSCC